MTTNALLNFFIYIKEYSLPFTDIPIMTENIYNYYIYY